MKKPLNVNCPTKLWPNGFTGLACLGVSGSSDSAGTAWLLFKVTDAKVESVESFTSATGDVPAEIAARNPDLIAEAHIAIWKLLSSNAKKFADSVSAGTVKIQGDYRLFGRYGYEFVKSLSSPDLWARVELLVRAALTENPTSPAN